MVILILALIMRFSSDMIASVMMLFGIYGFIIMLFGFAILVVIIGIYFANPMNGNFETNIWDEPEHI